MENKECGIMTPFEFCDSCERMVPIFEENDAWLCQVCDHIVEPNAQTIEEWIDQFERDSDLYDPS